MTYDDWKTRSDRDEAFMFGLIEQPSSWCDACEHDECDCPCCTEPPDDGRVPDAN